MIMQIHRRPLLRQPAAPYPSCTMRPDLLLSTENEYINLTSVVGFCAHTPLEDDITNILQTRF